MNNKTYISNLNKSAQWYLIDAENKNLGRISTTIAQTLKGKNNVNYTPYITSKAYVVVVNAKGVQISGSKKTSKLYYRHSGRPGSLKIENFTQLQKRIPARIIEKSVKGMLPKNALGRKLFTYLRVYSDSFHPHNAQKPIKL